MRPLKNCQWPYLETLRESVYITDDKVIMSNGVYFRSATHVVQLDL